MRIHPAVNISLIFLSASAWAVGSGGYTNQVVGAKSLGMGYTFAAIADDPSAVYFNPAGLARQKGFAVSLGAVPVVFKTDYTPDAGPADATESATPVVPYFYISSPVHDRWTVALGVNAPFGLETHWRDDGPLRYVATDSNLQYVGFNPTAAYRVNDRVSLGGGVVYARVSAQLDSRLNETALNSFLNAAFTPSPDGGKSLEGDGDGWGWNLGVLYEPLDGHTVGLSYRSAVKASIKGETRLSGMTNTSTLVFGGENYATDTETELDFPSSLFLGYAFQRGPWTWSVDGEWVGYSVVDETKLDFAETDATRLAILNDGNPVPRDWDDSWNLGAGVNYAVTEAFQARGGLFYYPAVVPDVNWDPSTPDSAVMGYTLGGGWTAGSLTIDLGYNFIQFDRKTVHNGVGASSLSTVNGAYETTAHIFALGVTWRTGGAAQAGQ